MTDPHSIKMRPTSQSKTARRGHQGLGSRTAGGFKIKRCAGCLANAGTPRGAPPCLVSVSSAERFVKSAAAGPTHTLAALTLNPTLWLRAQGVAGLCAAHARPPPARSLQPMLQNTPDIPPP